MCWVEIENMILLVPYYLDGIAPRDGLQLPGVDFISRLLTKSLWIPNPQFVDF